MGSDSLPMATPYAMAISFKPVHKHGQTDADPAASVTDGQKEGGQERPEGWILAALLQPILSAPGVAPTLSAAGYLKR